VEIAKKAARARWGIKLLHPSSSLFLESGGE